jgi:hypothetical protein
MKPQVMIRPSLLLAAVLAPLLSLANPAQALFSVDFADFNSPAPSVLRGGSGCLDRFPGFISV